MSDTMMSVDRARRLTDGGHHTAHTGLVMPAARTIVHQAETVETLSRLLSEAEEAAIERAEQVERLRAALREADRNWHDALGSEYEYTCKPEGFISTYESLLPGDMEAPE